MPAYDGAPTVSQQIALAMTPKFTSFMSLCGSAYIIFDILRTTGTGFRKKPRTPYHRLLLGLSITDMMSSAGLFTSTWPMPTDTPFVWGAVGNTRTCEVVGFFESMGVGSVMYNASLSWYYVLRIQYGITDEKMYKEEFVMHTLPLVVCFGCAFASLGLKLFNSGIFDCWIAPLPLDCKESWKNGGETNCIRGDNASLYQWLFDIIPKLSSILITTINMFRLLRAVKAQELKAMRYSNSYTHPNATTTTSNNQSTSTNQREPELKITKKLAEQSYWYVGALYITWMPVFITRATQLSTGVTYYEMLVWISIAIPLQGFWNVFVYLRPRYKRRQQERLRNSRRQQKQQEQQQQQQQQQQQIGPNAFPQQPSTDSRTSRTSREASGILTNSLLFLSRRQIRDPDGDNHYSSTTTTPSAALMKSTTTSQLKENEEEEEELNQEEGINDQTVFCDEDARIPEQLEEQIGQNKDITDKISFRDEDDRIREQPISGLQERMEHQRKLEEEIKAVQAMLDAAKARQQHNGEAEECGDKDEEDEMN